MTKLALINNNTNICENVTIDDRAANEINIEGYTILDLDNTSVINYVWNENLTNINEIESIGNGGIGCTYLNGKLINEKPDKPEIN
jgi:hypothetical protein